MHSSYMPYMTLYMTVYMAFSKNYFNISSLFFENAIYTVIYVIYIIKNIMSWGHIWYSYECISITSLYNAILHGFHKTTFWLCDCHIWCEFPVRSSVWDPPCGIPRWVWEPVECGIPRHWVCCWVWDPPTKIPHWMWDPRHTMALCLCDLMSW